MNTTTRLSARLAALESNLKASALPVGDPTAFFDKLQALASRFDESEAGTAPAIREASYSPAMRIAWALRFDPDPLAWAARLRDYVQGRGK